MILTVVVVVVSRALRSREKMDEVLAKYESVRSRVEATRRTLAHAAEKVERQAHIQTQLGELL